ncbi:ubiquitin-like domain-containing protein [Streptomyces sp. NPDC014724]|uniref:ubiquitin-like domain-containing protein n=1 Tax=unclassified Streptomyces TaxID=2593676 RepID=UPI003702BA6C
MSSSKGSHRAARGRGRTVSPAVPAPVPFHERLTLAVRVLHTPTLVGPRVVPARPSVPRATGGQAATRRAATHRAAARRASHHRKATLRPENLRRLVPQALVLAFLAGGTTAFMVCDKGVTLDIDGRTRTLHTFADDVGELLADQDVVPAARDVVTPAAGSALADGDEVVVRTGR